jgi:CarD family transcriptional regulator
MYTVGAKVVHPCHGAGTIVHIQEKSIGDISHTYYVIKTASSSRSMQLMVPVNRADDVGLRQVGKPSKLRKALQSCSEKPAEDDIEKDFRTRQSIVTDKLKSGQFEEITDAVRDLFFLNTLRPLGMTDRRTLEEGKEILAGELALAAGLDIGDAMKEINESLAAMIPEDEE